ncbi:MAG: sporulation protein YabP [Erysipelotrichaceae bacterium]|nr:sporulation protein YabP [Erysipelotrichaceae bacterium]
MNEMISPIKFETNPYHNVVIKDRKHIEISGVRMIDSLDSQEFLMETTQGWLLIKGKDLILEKLDTDRGDVNIKGTIEAMQYIDNKKSSDKEGFFSKLLK